MTATFLALHLLPRPAPAWGGGILFDDAARESLAARSSEGRHAAAVASTIGYYALVSESLVAEGLLLPLSRGSQEVATQLTLVNLQSFAFTALVFKVSELTVRRARPRVWDCMRDGGSYDECREHGLGGTHSFMSGHVGVATTAAALICNQQLHLQLYGRTGAQVTCGIGIALAALVGVGRVVSDNHYASDVLAGAMVGVVSGWVLPSALHYGFGHEGQPATAVTALSWATPF